MQCPECKSNNINKNGHKKGKQNYICVNCGRQFIDCYETQRGYCEDVKRECLKMYVNGMGFRGIERVKNVHHTTVLVSDRSYFSSYPNSATPSLRCEL